MSSHGGRRSGSGHKKIFASYSARFQFWQKTHKRISLDGTIFSCWVSAEEKVKGILVVVVKWSKTSLK